jgi:dihydrofolate synthase/folylpolyglutamate synthase
MTNQLSPHDAANAALERLRALHPIVIDLSLDRMARLCACLGHPERRMPPAVHVAGTNGKGSTVAYLRAMAEAAGQRAHVFTSPHLVRFNERIRLAGSLIDDAALARLIDRVEAVNDEAPITFFEFVTAAAFLAFAETPADISLIEVGLGGRLDASNVIMPRLAVIAPVDMDHRDYLGDTLAKIAAEKAGILKPGVPAVIGRQRVEALEVIEARTQAIGAPLTVMGRDFDAWGERDRLLVQLPDRLLDLPAPALAGRHQVDNAGLAVAAAVALGLDEAAIARGLETTVWPARFQRLTAGPLGRRAVAAGADLWLDGGHNPHAGLALARSLGDLSARDGRPVTLISGLLSTKDADGFFAAFAQLKPRVIAVSFPGNAMPATRIGEAARAAGLDVTVWEGDLPGALELALDADPVPHVIVAGSLHLAGEALALSEETWPR